MQTKRLFAAVKLNPDTAFQQAFARLQGELSSEKIKWVEPYNLHLTLKFFGETPDSLLPAIKTVLAEAHNGVGAFNLQSAETGIFGSRYNPRVIWMGFQPQPALARLTTQIISLSEPLGFERDRQNFVPHLTLGRIREVRNKARFQDILEKYWQLPQQTFATDRFYLYESILHPAGPEYKELESFALDG